MMLLFLFFPLEDALSQGMILFTALLKAGNSQIYEHPVTLFCIKFINLCKDCIFLWTTCVWLPCNMWKSHRTLDSHHRTM